MFYACKSPGPQTLLARLPSRLFVRTDSRDLLIRNRHLAHDPLRLPKDATKWSITQSYETQPRPLRSRPPDFTSGNQRARHEFVYSVVLFDSIPPARFQQHIGPKYRAQHVKHSKSSQSESSKFPGNLCDWSQAKDMKNTPCAGLILT